MGVCLAGLAMVASVLVAGPARADVPVVGLITVDPLNIDHWGTLTATLSGNDSCAQPVTYDWDFDGDGSYDDLVGTTSNSAEWPAAQWSSGPGTYEVGVRANVCGATFPASADVTVPGLAGSFYVTLSGAVTEVGIPAPLFVTIQNRPAPDDFGYSWDLDGDGAFDDSSATYGTFEPTAIGTFQARVRVLHKPSGSFAIATSTIRVEAPPEPVTLAPAVVTGTPKVSYVLVASGATPTPGNAVRTVKWLRDGVPITGATLATYRLTTADAGRRVRIEVRATLSGYADSAPVLSNSVAVAAHNSVRPTFSGTLRVGRKLTGTRGTWYAPNHTYTYRWLRDGKAISGATALTYVTKSTDRGKRISLRVTRQRAGFPTVHAYSVARTISR
ncbi:hypothetical protein [Nocardioides sp. Root190]|uniref:hypothetical protein n=1 Tax=Nocardioides sp. Root190 TaxID=1736488 RepID=UPI001F3610E1|nr:hypothetical protein [Nocardioides sp. Root190]